MLAGINHRKHIPLPEILEECVPGILLEVTRIHGADAVVDAVDAYFRRREEDYWAVGLVRGVHATDFVGLVALVEDPEGGEAGEPVRGGDMAGGGEEEGVEEEVVDPEEGG